MELIIFQFITDVERDENEAGEADCKPHHIDHSILQVPGDVPEGNKKVEFEHDLKNFVVVMVATGLGVLSFYLDKINIENKIFNDSRIILWDSRDPEIIVSGIDFISFTNTPLWYCLK